jgi:hypothetical protein
MLGRSGTLNFGSTAPARRYLRILLRDSPVRRSIYRDDPNTEMAAETSRKILLAHQSLIFGLHAA